MKFDIIGSAVACLFLFGCTPSPEEVCTHIDQVFQKDPNASKFKKFDKANCVSNGEMKKEFAPYKEYAGCTKKAETIESVNECAKKMDAALK